MIISHKHKFIFIKTAKTACTSIEIYLSQFCGENDVITEIFPEESNHQPQNFKGRFNIFRELYFTRGRNLKKTLSCFIEKLKFYNHMPATFVKARIDKKTWDSYYKFCVERDPWSKSISNFNMKLYRRENIKDFDEYLMKFKCLNYPLYTDFKNPNKIIVDKVIDYKNLNKELDVVFKKIGIPFSGSLNTKSKHNYKENSDKKKFILNKKQIDLIAKQNFREISLFGYQYNKK